ncbi:alpha-L-fucosidase [Flavobacterium succinicans]|uniref:alpha-L-fucosidase n=1 Tax=Flavobacterium succinicans TaxID=29536 RepID=A0A199XTK8_9FLAO|nr:alpha-L-fucosidase [Flavobacterium succinicans]OAZ05093.1 alpha-L-fucosidase [Flavobacterium succinicans]
MKKVYIVLFAIYSTTLFAQKNSIVPIASKNPSAGQMEMISRKYGMFIHFGINTFHNQEWTDGTKPASSYNPTSIDAEQWVKTAKNAGMKYVILITKHHDGFCLWNSMYTEYDVGSSSNTTNVVEAVARACKKHNMSLGLYYSLWDRNKNANTSDITLDAAYNEYMINQLNELITITKKYTKIVEFWFDGGWEKPNYRWPTQKIYHTIKSRVPNCQVGINWTIGLPENPDFHLVVPKDQKTGYPIRYFPSDFRLGDPYLPKENDPKIFTHEGKEYYLPWESTVCMSQKWFFNSKDTIYKSVDDLYDLYTKATANDNVLILNCPPNTEGKMREKDRNLLLALKKKIDKK